MLVESEQGDEDGSSGRNEDIPRRGGDHTYLGKLRRYPLANQLKYGKWAIEIVALPIEHCDFL